MSRHADLARVKSGMIRRLAEWWLGFPGPPDRADFDPLQWKRELPYLLIAEGCAHPRAGEKLRIRYRLVGSACVYAAGFDFTGRYLDDMQTPHSPEDWRGHYEAARASARPVYGEAAVPTFHGQPFAYEFGILPLTAGGGEIRQFLGIEDFGRLQPRLQSTLLDLTLHKASE